MTLTKKIISLLVFIILAFGASAWGGLVTSFYKEPWYSTIIKPEFNPPDWIFAPVWITLYIAMSVAAWLICSLMVVGVYFSLDFTLYLYL